MGRRPVLERPLCIDYEYHNSTVFAPPPVPLLLPVPLPLCQPPTPLFLPPATPSLYNAKVLIGPSGGLSAFDLITATVTLH